MKCLYPRKFILEKTSKILLYLNLLFLITTLAEGQTLLDFPCYTVSGYHKPNQLFTYNPATCIWVAAPNPTGTSFIEAIATDPVNDIIYASGGGTFGTIDAATGIFTAIGEVGSGHGDNGEIMLDDIMGLTYDPINRLMYATHRIAGFNYGTEDLLFKIDVATGHVVAGAMRDESNAPSDYAVIPGITGFSFGYYVPKISDIAYNPYTGQLFALHHVTQLNSISVIDQDDASLESVYFEIKKYDLEGLGFSYLGELYATTGDNGNCDPENPADISCNNIFIFVDFINLRTENLSDIDPTGFSVDFESFDCLTAFNDLALQMVLDAETPSTVNSGDTVTFQITVYNQGDFTNNDIQITNYIPQGLTLFDDNWNLEQSYWNGSGTTTKILPMILESGESATVPITFIINDDFSGDLVNTAEISASFNQDIIDSYGNIMRLPDFDSSPDYINNENPAFVVNDEINKGGLNANADEDDHDIELLTVETSATFCPADLTITASSPFQNKYQCKGNLKTNGFVLIQANQQVEYMANIVTLNMGFEVKHGAGFYADSAGCN